MASGSSHYPTELGSRTAQTAFHRLSMVERELLWMHYADGTSIDQLADLLEVSARQVTLSLALMISRYRAMLDLPPSADRTGHCEAIVRSGSACGMDGTGCCIGCHRQLCEYHLDSRRRSGLCTTCATETVPAHAVR